MPTVTQEYLVFRWRELLTAPITRNTGALCALLDEQEIDMLIGNFTYDAGEDTYSGDITTLSMQRSGIQLRPNKKTGDWDPDYRMTAETDSGMVEFGAAWKRKSEKGRLFLSVALDDPSLSSPVNAALFPGEDGETAALVWNRPKRKAKTSE